MAISMKFEEVSGEKLHDHERTLKSDQKNCLVRPSNNERDCAVYINNVSKSYDHSTPVLSNFCMNIKKGTIYGLLGSSGCGKTTMLSCIVGLEKWESGELLVFGKRPGTKGSEMPGKKLGYMPQDVALYKHLTIREIIQFYGQLYNMGNSEITEMWDFLVSLLQLPVNSTLIGNLSGGQKRRASLCLAMIHSPELLVLDEPTAGVDPLLRKNVWNHLHKLVRTMGTTVLITTHYIEEARLANTLRTVAGIETLSFTLSFKVQRQIGVMRQGRLLVEDCPTNILNSYNCNLLEEAVRLLCRKDESNLQIQAASSILVERCNNVRLQSSSWKQNPIFRRGTKSTDGENRLSLKGFKELDIEKCHEGSKRLRGIERRTSYSGSISGQQPEGLRKYRIAQSSLRIHGLTKVTLLTLFRNPVYLILILFLPAIQGILTILTIGSEPRGLHLGVVNHELANWTKECKSSQHLRNECYLSPLSCQYINYLTKEDLLALNSYPTEEDARADVDIGKSLGYLIFRENFSQNSMDLGMLKQYSQNESILGSKINVHLDYSEYVQVSLVLKHLLMAYMEFAHNLAYSCDMSILLDGIPLSFRPPVYGTDDNDFSGYVVPGVVAISLFGLGIGLTGLIHVSDRKQGTLTRAQSAGLTITDVIAGHVITQMLVTILQLIIWHTILHFIFHFTILGSPCLWLVFCLLSEMAGAIAGLLLGQIFKDETQVLLIIIFLYTIFVFFGCVFIPVERMQKFWQYFSAFVPTYLPTNSMRSIVVRGADITHPLVWPGLVSLAGWIVVLSVCVVIAFKFIRT